MDPHGDTFLITLGASPAQIVQAAPGQAAGVVQASASATSEREFRLVPGLTGQGYSFASVAHPGYYLRHANFQVFLHADDGSALFRQDATFSEGGALDGTSGAWSWISVNYPDRWIVAVGGQLRLQSGPEMRSARDATFRTTNAR